MKAFIGTERYELLAQLGSGTFGEVYAVYDRERGTKVALKRPHDTSPDSLYYFKREFRNLADTVHPNLVELYELVVEAGQWFFTMELVDGLSFTRHLRQNPSGIDDEALRALLRQLAEGLLALHRAGKLHRDIKPSNVLVTREGKVVILDFGLSVDLPPVEGVDTLTTRRVGTPTYMAPEQLDGYQGTKASDWYSVGVMLYEVLAGRPPFSLGSVSEMTRAKLSQEPMPPSEWLEDVPGDLEDICMGLLRRLPSERMGGEDLLARLEAAPGEKPLGPELPMAPPRFIGRKAELEHLSDLLEHARQGRSLLVQLHGGSGTGKTQLLRHFMEKVRRGTPGAVVLHSRCYTQESVPFKALDPLVDGLSRYLMRLPPAKAATLAPRNVQTLVTLFPVLDRVEAFRPFASRRPPEPEDMQSLLRRACLALRELLGRIGELHPLLVVIDDLQWGDSDSIRILRDILSPPDPPAMMVVVCYRTEDVPASPALQELLVAPTGAQAEEMALPQLSLEDAEALALALIGPDVSNAHLLAARIARDSEGNPFYIGELAHQVRLRCLSAAEPADVDLFSCILRRMGSLPGTLRQIVELLAVAGHPLTWEVVKGALGLEGSAVPPIGLFRSGRLLRMRNVSGRTLEMYHDYVRRAVLASLGEAEKRRLHGRLATSLEAAGGVLPESVAQHYLEAGETDKAIEWTTMAADRAAAVLAFKNAAELYRRSIALRPSDDPLVPALLLHLAQALSHAGLGKEAGEHYLDLASRIQGPERLGLKRRAAEEYFRCGQFDLGLAIIRPLLAQQGIRMPTTRLGRRLANALYALRLRMRGHRFTPREEARVPAEDLEKLDTCWAVVHGLGTGALMSSMDLQLRHLLLALKVGEPSRVIRALAHQTYLEAIHDGDQQRNRTAFYDALSLTLAERHGDPRLMAYAHMTSGMAAFFQGRFLAAEEALMRARSLYTEKCMGVTTELQQVQRSLLHTQFLLGRIEETEQGFERQLKEAKDRGDLLAEANLVTSYCVTSFLLKGDLSTARAFVARGRELCTMRNFHAQMWQCLYLGGIVECYAGNAKRAWMILDDQEQELTRVRMLDVDYIYLAWCEHVARISLTHAKSLKPESPEWQAAIGRAQPAIRALEGHRTHHYRSTYAKMRAIDAELRGQREATLAWLRTAEDGYREQSMLIHVCSARWNRGALMGESGRDLRLDALRRMKEHGISNPVRWFTTQMPCVPADEGSRFEEDLKRLR